MNRIKTIRQLNAEKKQLHHRREELEKAIHYDWIDLKKTANIKTTAKSFFDKIVRPEEKQKYNSNISNAASQLAAILTGNLTENAMKKIKSWLKSKLLYRKIKSLSEEQ